MKIELKNHEGNKKIYTVEFDGAELKAATDKVYKANKSKYSIPGFRKGKVPKQIIELHYGKEVFYGDALEILAQEALVEFGKNDDRVVGQPELGIEDLGEERVVLTFDFELVPEIELKQYKGLEIEKPSYPVTDEDVMNDIDQLRERNARFETVERPIENGDSATIDFVGYIGDEAFEGGEGNDYPLEIGSGAFIPGFEEQLVGKSTGEEVEVKVTFPEEYHAENLAGKDATFKVTIKEVKNKELPELDDDFVSEATEFETVEELKNGVRADMERQAKFREDGEFLEAIFQELVKMHEIESPEAMIEDEIDHQLNNLATQLSYQGITFDQYLQFTGQTLEQVRAERRETADFNVKKGLIALAVAKAEGIKVENDEEVIEGIKEAVTASGLNFEELKDKVTPEMIADYKPRVEQKKITDFLIVNNGK